MRVAQSAEDADPAADQHGAFGRGLLGESSDLFDFGLGDVVFERVDRCREESVVTGADVGQGRFADAGLLEGVERGADRGALVLDQFDRFRKTDLGLFVVGDEGFERDGDGLRRLINRLDLGNRGVRGPHALEIGRRRGQRAERGDHQEKTCDRAERGG